VDSELDPSRVGGSVREGRREGGALRGDQALERERVVQPRCDPPILQRMLRHKDVRSTEFDAKLSTGGLIEAFRKR
jgi:hypothetical protein